MRLTNLFRRQPHYVEFERETQLPPDFGVSEFMKSVRLPAVFRGASVPDFDTSAHSKTIRLAAAADDFPNAYRLVSAIYFCVNLVADSVASTPLRFYKKGVSGKKTYQEPEDGGVAGLWATANSEDTGRDMIFGIAASRGLFGTGDLFFEDMMGDGAAPGEIQGLHLLNPLAVEIRPGRNRTIEGWRVKDGAKWRDFARHKIEHFPRFDPRFGRVPVAPLEPLTVEYEAIYDAMRVIRNLAKNSFVPPGFFTTKGSVGDDVRKRIGRQIRRMLDRLMTRKNDAMILPSDITFQGAAVTIANMQLTETDRMVFGKILNCYRIPPVYAGIMEGGGLNSDTMKSARGLFHELVREPECSAIAAVMNERVLPRFGVTGLQCEFDFSKILAVQEQRIDAANKILPLTGGPILTRNEGREWIGLVPLDEPGTDALLESIGMLTADDRDDMEAAAATSGDDTDAGTDAAPEKGKRTLGDVLLLRDRRDHLRARSQGTLMTHERSMKRGFLRVFKRQRARAVTRVREQLDGRMADYATRAGLPLLRALDLDDLLRDDQGDTRIIRRIMRAIVEQQGSAALAEITLEFAFTLTGEMREWIEQNAARSITETSETTRARLRKSLGEGVGKNEGMNELIGRVDRVFDGRRGNAATIARTETAAPYHRSSIEGWEQSGEVEFEEWASSKDDAVRETHREADGQVVRLGDSFIVGGEPMRYPGDESASPENRCNDRCVLLPVLRQRVLIPGPIASRMNGHVNGNGKPKRSVKEWLNATP